MSEPLYNFEDIEIPQHLIIARCKASAIVRKVAELHQVDFEQMTQPSSVKGARRRHLAVARFHAMFEVEKHLNWSLPRLGGYFGGRDHTTVLHGLRRWAAIAAANEGAA